MDWPPVIYLMLRLCTMDPTDEVCMDATVARPFITYEGCYSSLALMPLPDGWEVRMATCKPKEERV